MKWDKKQIWTSFLYFLLAVLVTVVEQVIVTYFVIGEQSLLKTVFGCLVFVAIGLAGLWLAKRVGLFSPRDSFSANEAVKVVALGFGATYVAKLVGGIALFIEYGLEGNTANQEFLNSLDMPLIVYALLAVLVAPVIEELVMRGLLMGRVFGQQSWFGLVVSSILFGLLHGPTDIGSWLMYGGMGLVFGYVYRRTGKFEYPLAIHALNNLLAVIFMALMQ